MLVSRKIMEELYEDAGIGRRIRAEDYVKEKRVTIIKTNYEDSNNFSIHAEVEGHGDYYHTYLSSKNGEIEDVSCECMDYQSTYGTCKHILATILEFSQREYLEKQIEEKKNSGENRNIKIEPHKEEYRTFKQLLSTFYQGYEEQKVTATNPVLKQRRHSIKIEPKLILEPFQKRLKVEFKIGDKQLYKLKDLAQFYQNMVEHQNYHYGAKLEFVHEMDQFTEESQRIVEFILKYAELMNYMNTHISSSYYGPKPMNSGTIILTNNGLDELFEILKGRNVFLEEDYTEVEIQLIEKNPEIQFKVEEINQEEYKITTNVEVFHYHILQGKSYQYFLQDQKLYRCTKEFAESTLKMLEVFRRNFTEEMLFKKEELTKFFSFVLPKVKESVNLKELNQEEIEKYIPKDLAVKVFLDFDPNNYMIAEVKFCYGEKEFNPICEKIKEPRDMVKEDEVITILKNTGFLLDQKKKRFVLTQEEDIYHFLSEEINFYMQKFEVMATDQFKQKEIRLPKLGTVGVRIENNLLDVQLDQMNFDPSELEEILKKYRLRKKYHRLKDGSFLTLEENEEIAFLDNITSGIGIEDKNLEKGELHLPIYRSLYLDKMMESISSTEIRKAEEFKEMTSRIQNRELEADCIVPVELEAILRYYQKIGFQWLKTLDQYHLGGILADDMGLRKDYSNACCYSILPKRNKKRKKKTLYGSLSKFSFFKLEK